jgi:hypothetical protein
MDERWLAPYTCCEYKGEKGREVEFETSQRANFSQVKGIHW